MSNTHLDACSEWCTASSRCYRNKLINFSKEDDNSLRQSKEFVPLLDLDEIFINGRAIN